MLRRFAAIIDAHRIVLLNVGVAVVLAMAATAVARPLFSTQPPSFRPLNELAFNVPLPRDGPGPVLSAAVVTNGCDPWVDVVIVAQDQRNTGLASANGAPLALSARPIDHPGIWRTGRRRPSR